MMRNNNNGGAAAHHDDDNDDASTDAVTTAKKKLSELLLVLAKEVEFPVRRNFNRVIEQRRQRKLANCGKAERELGEEAFQVLQKFPSLAKFKYRNLFGNELYPLCSFVLALEGLGLETVEAVFRMHPMALREPLIKVLCGRGWEESRYFLLEAACKPKSGVGDDVILFLAKNYPEAISIFLQGGHNPPYYSRILLGPGSYGMDYAPLEVIKALVPQSHWRLEFVSHLLSLGYDVEILNYAVDMLLKHGNKSTPVISGNEMGTFDVCSRFKGVSRLYQPRALGLLDYPRALVLEHLLCPLVQPNNNNASGYTPAIRRFQCRPTRWAPLQWTQEGLNHTLKCMVASKTIHTMILNIQQIVNSNDEATSCEMLVLLEELFATNNTIVDVALTAQDEQLGAILKGLVRAKTQVLQKLTLQDMAVANISSFEPFLNVVYLPLWIIFSNVKIEGHWSTGGRQLPGCVYLKLDKCTLTQGLMVETLNVVPKACAPSRLVIGANSWMLRRMGGGSLPAIAGGVTESLLKIFQQGQIQELHILGSPSLYDVDIGAICAALRQDMTLKHLEMEQSPVGESEEHLLMKHIFSLLKENATLEQLIVHNKKAKVDYTGCYRFSTCYKVFNKSLAERMQHSMRLNRFGRQRVRRETTTREEFIALLATAQRKLHDELKGRDNGLAYLNVIFGLLLEFQPNQWSPATMEHAKDSLITPGEKSNHSGPEFSGWNVFLNNPN